MATHGRTGLARLVLGSVATHVLQHASVPVLLVGPAALRTALPVEARTHEEADAELTVLSAPSWLGG